MPKLDTHRHLGYELLTALLGDLLAVPQVNVADVPTALEEGQALVSDLIAVCGERIPCERPGRPLARDSTELYSAPSHTGLRKTALAYDGEWFPPPVTKGDTC